MLARSGADPGAVGLLIHGTTLATNAIIERKGALTALVCTRRLPRRARHRLREPLRPVRHHAREAARPRAARTPTRGAGTGRRARPGAEAPDESAVEAVADELARLEVESVGVGFLHSYANPTHERRAGEILAAALPDVSITLSSEACPEVREYERFCTTRGERVRAAAHGELSRAPSRPTARPRPRLPGAAHDVGRRPREPRHRDPVSHPARRIGPRPAARFSRRASPPRWGSTRSSRSTWAGPPPRSASSTTARRRPRASSRSIAKHVS